MLRSLEQHWPEYSMEAAELALFMLSACAFTVLLHHPASPLSHSFPNEILRRASMGLAMGSTAIAIIFSPLGKRSGAHFNPSVTLAFLRLGKVRPWDAAFYIVAQFIGGITGVVIAMWLLGPAIADQHVNYATTQPGPQGIVAAFVAELLISFVLMSVVLRVSNTQRLARWTGVFAGALVATYITFESPVSGMSMNPARTFGSAFGASLWVSLWIYFTAPPIGMLLAAEVFKRVKTRRPAACAKFHHHNNQRCIFRCNFEMTTTY
jgi:aquaporin Z